MVATSTLLLIFGLRETSDSWGDALQLWWSLVRDRFAQVKRLVIYLDNGPNNSGSRTQFLKRMVQFADWSGLEIRLVYYPPYHSKYNPVERCWSSLESKFCGVLMSCAGFVLGCARRMTWKGEHPAVHELEALDYPNGVKLSGSSDYLGGWLVKRGHAGHHWGCVEWHDRPVGDCSMSAAGLYRVLGLDTWPSETDGRLRVLIQAPREGLRCRACGSSRVHVHEHAVRSWESAPIGLTPVDVVMDSPRVKCLKCGAKTWHQPTFANGQRRITKTFEAFIERQLTRLTIQDVVEMYGLSWNTVSEIDLARLKKLARPKLGGLKRLAIDENYLGARHGFVTIVLDLDTMAIMSVLKGRGKQALKPFFSKLKQARAKIKAVATDMAGGYIAAVMEYLPQAALVFDRFHVIKLMNEKLTDLRREMYNELTDKQHRKMWFFRRICGSSRAREASGSPVGHDGVV